MAAIHNHFDRLRALLAADVFDEIYTAYKRDAAQDSKDSRQRSKERVAKLKASRAALSQKLEQEARERQYEEGGALYGYDLP